MPVTFRPADHQARQVECGYGPNNASELLEEAANDLYVQSEEMLQTSFGEPFGQSGGVVPQYNGFVRTVVDAYSRHHVLVIRPDDVWLTIIAQFNSYVNAHAEELRHLFVAHEGKKHLVVYASGSRYSVDFGYMARQMGHLISQNVVDKELRNWIVPAFTTTTITDRTVSCIIMMATLKAYFSYEFCLDCGLPQVTLEGTKRDWVQLRAKIEKLKTYGVQCIAWYHLLAPVLDRFVKAFDDPHDEGNITFWRRVVHVHDNGSGAPSLSGWITAFCVFTGKGKWMGHELYEKVDSIEDPAALSAEEFWAAFIVKKNAPWRQHPQGELVLDQTSYHHVSMAEIPRSIAEVDVLLNDNGQKFDTLLVAGLVGSQIGNSGGDASLSECGGVGDTLAPVVGWWMFIKRGSPRNGVKGDTTVPPEIPVDKDFDLEAGLKGGDSDADDGVAGVAAVADLAKSYGQSRLSATLAKFRGLFGCLRRDKTEKVESVPKA